MQFESLRKLAIALTGWILAVGPVSAQSVPGCGSLQNEFGPFDYRDAEMRAKHLEIVERLHFTPDVESLKRGQSGYLIGDIDYTLRAWPNHPRALNAVGRYALSGGNRWSNRDIQSADCYFLRAIAFRPDDETVRMLFGNYLFKKNDSNAARIQYEEALRLAPQSPEVNYNAGLFYLSENEIEKAREHARIAYDGGYPLPGLKKKLEAHQRQQGD